MTKAPNLPSLTGQYLSTTQVNAAFEAIEEAFQNTLSLDGSTPNSMQADLDMDSNDILNAKRIEAKTIVVDGVDVRDLLDDLPGLLNGTYTEYVAIYDGDGTSSPLTLPLSVDDPDRLLVIVNGSVVRPDYDYTVSNFSVFPTGDLSVWPHGEKNITIRLKREVDFAVIQDSDINSNGLPLSSVLSAGGPGTTRALLVSLVAAGWNPAVGTVVQAAGLSYRRVTGATAIADLPGWVPHGPVVPEHWAAVGDATADDYAALQKWLDFICQNEVEHGVLRGRYLTSKPLEIPNTAPFGGNGRVIQGLKLLASPTFSGESTFLLTLRASRWKITQCYFDGGGVADGININGTGRHLINSCHFRNIPNYCLYTASTMQDCIVSGNHFQPSVDSRQTKGTPYTAYGIYAPGGDWTAVGNTFQWTKCAVWTNSGGIILSGNHIYQGAGGGDELTPMTGRDDGVAIRCSGQNIVITGNYIDKGQILVNATIRRNGLQIVGNLFYTRATYADADAFVVIDATSDFFVKNAIITGNNFHNNAVNGAADSPNLVPVVQGTSTLNPIDRFNGLIGSNYGNLTENGQILNGTVSGAEALFSSKVDGAPQLTLGSARSVGSARQVLSGKRTDGGTGVLATLEVVNSISGSDVETGRVSWLADRTTIVNAGGTEYRVTPTRIAPQLPNGANLGAGDRPWAAVYATEAYYGNNLRRIIGTENTNPNGVISGSPGAIHVNQGSPTWAQAMFVKIAGTGSSGWGVVQVSVPPRTVETLPSAATAGAGARGWVTDATQTHTAGIGAIVAGGGSNFVPVYSDGTNWRIG